MTIYQRGTPKNHQENALIAFGSTHPMYGITVWENISNRKKHMPLKHKWKITEIKKGTTKTSTYGKPSESSFSPEGGHIVTLI